MTLQTIQFESVSLRQVGSGAITAKLFSGSTVAATLSSITEDATRDGRYTGTVEDEAAATYDLQVQFDGVTVSEPNETVALLLAVGTYVAKRAAVLDSATVAKIDAILEDTGTTLPALIGSSGTGARTVTITVNDGTTALQNATVRMTEGANTFTSLTNASGVAVFNLDDATYTVGVTKAGYTYAGTTLIVDGTETATYSMTVVSITPPADPALCAVAFHLRDQYGVDKSGEPVEITFVKWETGAAETPPIVSVPPVQTTDADGLVEVELYRDATYRIVYGSAGYARRVDVVVPDASSYTVEI